MSECPKYVRVGGSGCEGPVVYGGEPSGTLEHAKVMQNCCGGVIYRIDAATKVWPVTVTYSVEWFDDDRSGDNPRWRCTEACRGLSYADANNSFFVQAQRYPLLPRRVVDSTGQVIATYRHEVVEVKG